MPRRRKTPKPRKPYERRIDLAPYQRLMQFLRWMSLGLQVIDVLRMLPQSENWTPGRLAREAETLSRRLEQWGVPVAALVPGAVSGTWTWPPASREVRGERASPEGIIERSVQPLPARYGGVPRVRRRSPADPWVGLTPGGAELLGGDLPTVEGLCRLADELRDILEDLCETDTARIRQRWGTPPVPVPDFYHNGEARALFRLRLRVNGKITLSLTMVHPRETGTRRTGWRIEEQPQEHDFATYAAWQLVRVIRDGHAWRLTRCTSCQAWFLRVRRDPTDRPARFCSDVCRRAWHNPRRGKYPHRANTGGADDGEHPGSRS
jgi:hypothetical protein